MKKLILLICITIPLYVFCQTPRNDNNWNMNNTFSDEFNMSLKNIWHIYIDNNPRWGIGVFKDDYVNLESEGRMQFLRLSAVALNGNYYAGGIHTGVEFVGLEGLGYGYYEIQARLQETTGIQSGLWPAFWTVQGIKDTLPTPQWYEEIDIFEPDNCQVQAGQNVCGYWHQLDPQITVYDTDNRHKDQGICNNLDLQLWHKYAIEWTPGRLLFYVDDISFFWLLESRGDTVPSHDNTNLEIDLQVGGGEGQCPPRNVDGSSVLNGSLGNYDINYFRYYQLSCSNEIITETLGDNYNFYNYVHDIKQSCIFKNTSIPTNTDISIRASDFVTLKNNFSVPLGVEFSIIPTKCFN